MNIPGAVAAIKAFKQASKGDTVNEIEILRRTAICSVCPVRQLSTGVVSRVSQTLGVIANRHRVHRELRDYRCGVCKCALMLLIPSKVSHVDTPAELLTRPAECWVLTDEQRVGKIADKIEDGCDC
jgi:hypothetical protein|tara:strand:- start:1536 stop:1913 length:378 start_codon:yes stop_codon:yes gene_type:complete